MRGLAWCAVLAALVAGTAEARTRGFSTQTIIYLDSKSAPTETRTVTLSASAADSFVTISYVPSGYDWPDTLGDATAFWFEWTPVSSATSPTLKFYIYVNTRLNGADTLNTTAGDSVLVQAGSHVSDWIPMDRAWKLKAVDGGGGGTLTYQVKRRPGWFQW